MQLGLERLLDSTRVSVPGIEPTRPKTQNLSSSCGPEIKAVISIKSVTKLLEALFCYSKTVVLTGLRSINLHEHNNNLTECLCNSVNL